MFKIIIKGIVQGVGFRPFIYKKAKEAGSIGSVKNIGAGVEIISDQNFVKDIKNWPPLAKIDSIELVEFKNQDHEEEIKTIFSHCDFKIEKSKETDGVTQLPADIFTCDECINELRDKNDRRYNYYFTTCTNCGPRYSMIHSYPYDRPNTSMDEFDMCDECKKEYTDPMDRRYHAQTIACHNCGPKLKLICNNLEIKTDSDLDTIEQAVKMLKNGKIISIKGVGGFHICSLTDDNNALKVRHMLNRLDKPFALMVKDLEMLEKVAYFNEKERELITSPQRPIVVLRKKEGFKFVSELDSLGIMLPYTALHFLLFDLIDEPLLFTSANLPGDPVNIDENLGEFHLTHSRKIINRCDDSVMKVIGNKNFFLRRSRGFAPIPIKIPIHCKPTLALGAEMNSTICVSNDKDVYMSQYIGNTKNIKTFEFFKDTIKDYLKLTKIKPEIITCDLHPEYFTTKYAEKLIAEFGSKLIKIQHHKAHIASVAAEHNLNEYIGISCDGTGFGEDGNIWGGEVFYFKNNNFTRVGSLENQPMLGGDSAVKNPKKMLFGILSKFLSKVELQELNLFSGFEMDMLFKQISEDYNIVNTSSTGRVLDAISSLLEICDNSSYDARPILLLESFSNNLHFSDLKNSLIHELIKTKVEDKEGRMILNTTHLVKEIFSKFIQFKDSPNEIEYVKNKLAYLSQYYIAEGLYQIASMFDKEIPIVFSGGVAYNNIISEYMINKGVLINKNIPCGDGGISYGQVYLANLFN
jgi:hydrogenase maturation protein HypF